MQRYWVDTDNLLVSQPDFGEQALEILETVIRSGAVDLVVVDSVVCLNTKSRNWWWYGWSTSWSSKLDLWVKL